MFEKYLRMKEAEKKRETFKTLLSPAEGIRANVRSTRRLSEAECRIIIIGMRRGLLRKARLQSPYNPTMFELKFDIDDKVLYNYIVGIDYLPNT